MKVSNPVLVNLITILRKRRIALGLSQSQLADLVARKQTWISKVENGMRELSLMEFLQLCGPLHLSPESVLRSLRASLGFSLRTRKNGKRLTK